MSQRGLKLLCVDFHRIYSSLNIFKIIEWKAMVWAGHVARRGRENTFKILFQKPVSKRPLGRHSRGWEDNIKVDWKEVGFNCFHSIERIFKI